MKADRHEKILELISRYEIETQEELASYLMESGFPVTQATVSRDIRELKLSKVTGTGGHQKYASLTDGQNQKDPAGQDQSRRKLTRAMQDGFVTAKIARDLVVVRTVPGMAMSVAVALDAMEIPGMAGCIAGDDTVFCAIESEEQSWQVMKMIEKVVSDVN